MLRGLGEPVTINGFKRGCNTAIIFERLGDGLYDALYTPDPDERRAALADWVNRAVPVISAEIQEELSNYIAWVTDERWSEEDWRRGAEQWRRIQFSYHLALEIKLRSVGPVEKPPLRAVDGSDPLVPGPNRFSRHTLFRKTPVEAAAQRGQAAGDEGMAERNQVAGDRDTAKRNEAAGDEAAWQGDDDGDGSGRSPNDDRSDSMNPNNDSYQAAMDNHANQMNPNNDAYGSSRGR